MPNHAIVFDTETHAKVAPLVVEAAYGFLHPDTGKLQRESIRCSRFNPGVPIEYGALAVHHILNKDLAHCPPSSSFALPEGVHYVVGHNVGFDLGVVGNPSGIKAIDTLALSRAAWPEVSHTQAALFYMLHDTQGLDMELARDFVKSAHSARVDIQMCCFILDALIEWSKPLRLEVPDSVRAQGTPLFEELHYLSRAAEVCLVMPFGKHVGLPMQQLPQSYVNWYCALEDPDPRIVLAMRLGGDTQEGKQLFELATRLFGGKSKS